MKVLYIRLLRGVPFFLSSIRGVAWTCGHPPPLPRLRFMFRTDPLQQNPLHRLIYMRISWFLFPCWQLLYQLCHYT
jgi:hypothetical protein